MGRVLRWGGALAGLVAVLLLLVYGFLRGGAPRLDGELPLKGLSAEVRVSRDALGVPSILAKSRLDALRALGFLHAQDRFFQMDLSRRLAAGELSELVGSAAVDFDKRHRLFRLRALAEDVLAHSTPFQRDALQAYSQGVNAGLKALSTWPFEYGLLMTRPKPWKPEDSILVVDAMYFELQSPEDRHEAELALMRGTMAPPLFRFLSAPGGQWDAPVVGKPLETPPIPGADAMDLRKLGPTKLALGDLVSDAPLASETGSNNWVVSKAHSSSGSAMVSNDMHLGIRVPNTWYRAQWTYTDASLPGGSVTLTGVTLPGVPALVVGSNGHVAWGFTNSYGDWSDLVLLHLDPNDPDQYMVYADWRHFTHHSEVIKVKGGRDVTLEVRDTVWGPVLDQDRDGVTRVIHWMAAQPEGTNLALADMDGTEDVQQAMAVVNRAGMPEQNCVIADAGGHIAWTIAGRIPLRTGFDPSVPSYWDKPATGWTGWLDPAKYPRVVDPADGRLWSANARVVDGAMLSLIGDGGYDLGARAGQIRDDLHAKDSFTPADMLAIQLDDRALFLARWRSLLLRFLNPMRVANHPDRIAFRQAVADWDARASVDSVGYRLVREFRDAVESKALTPLFATCKQADAHCDYRSLPQLEGPLWVLVNQQPANLLDPAYKDWDALLLAAVNDVSGKAMGEKGGLAAYTWGARNTVHITHPLSGAVSFLARFLDMAPLQLPGDSNMPRVQGVDFGASERMSVSPGHEAEGILEMPTGQSGWPLSPYYRNSEPDWEQGKPAPFLPGKPEHTLVFKPVS